MTRIGWVNPEDEALTTDWPDAPTDPDVLASYLNVAYHQCVEYLPHRRCDGELVPVMPEQGSARQASCRLAQVMQARAIYNSVVAGAGDQVGPDGTTVTVFPMDWTVRNMLRPRRVGRVL